MELTISTSHTLKNGPKKTEARKIVSAEQVVGLSTLLLALGLSPARVRVATQTLVRGCQLSDTLARGERRMLGGGRRRLGPH